MSVSALPNGLQILFQAVMQNIAVILFNYVSIYDSIISVKFKIIILAALTDSVKKRLHTL